MTMFDLGPAVDQLARTIPQIRDEQLAGVTPCPAYTLGDLVEHGPTETIFSINRPAKIRRMD